MMLMVRGSSVVSVMCRSGINILYMMTWLRTMVAMEPGEDGTDDDREDGGGGRRQSIGAVIRGSVELEEEAR